ncbi:MAG: hypothetical protein IT436_05880 [Phycisphaerales bacterium]|nr:hypothetical protein [Phycisphaerales bacterium]
MLLRRTLPSAALLCSLALAAPADEATLRLGPSFGSEPGLMTVSIGADSVSIHIPPMSPPEIKAQFVAQALTASAYAAEFFYSGSEPFWGVILHNIPADAAITLETGNTASPADGLLISPPGRTAATIANIGRFEPFDTQGQPAIFTAGIVTDVGELSAQVSAAELSFQTDGPIICQALFQRLAPRAPQYGAQINYAGDRLEVYFDPAYTVTQGGIIFGTTSPSAGTSGTLPPAVTGRCPIDYNGDGLVDFADYLEFLNLYDAQDPRADLNGDGLVDFADYLEFLNLYAGPCP